MRTLKLKKDYLKYLNEEVFNDKNLNSKENEVALHVLSFLAFKEILRLQRPKEGVDYIFPSISAICTNIGIKTPMIVTKALVDLQTLGYITKTVQGQKGVCNRFYLKEGITSYTPQSEVTILSNEDKQNDNQAPSMNDNNFSIIETLQKEVNNLNNKIASLQDNINERMEFLEMVVRRLVKENKSLKEKFIQFEDQYDYEEVKTSIEELEPMPRTLKG